MSLTNRSLWVVAPLAAVSASGMLAMDMFVPALPELPADLRASVSLAQATVAVFFAALAGSQLFWGELFTRLGPRRTIVLSTLALAVTSAGCALARASRHCSCCARRRASSRAHRW